jgi:hypothetical protein
MSTAYRVVLNVVVYVKAEDEDTAEDMAYKIVQGRGGEGECDWDTMLVDEDPFNNDEEEG